MKGASPYRPIIHGWDVIISKVTEFILNNDSNLARHTSIKIYGMI